MRRLNSQARNKGASSSLDLRSPRLTATGLRLLLTYVAAPILAALALLDLGLYLFFRLALDRCYGVLCLF